MKTIKSFSVLIILVLLITSCSTDSLDGIDGKDGIVNISTTLFTVTPGQWVQHSNWFGVNLIVPGIKDSINDIVIVTASKVNTSYAGQWFGLPLTGIIVTGDLLDYVYGKGQATIGYNYYAAPTSNIIIKIQVISSGNYTGNSPIDL